MRQPKANLGQTTTLGDSEREGRIGLDCLSINPKRAQMGSLWVLDLHAIYTTIHEGCARLFVGLCTVHDIIVELGARLYDIKGGSVHSTRHRSRLLQDKMRR